MASIIVIYFVDNWSLGVERLFAITWLTITSLVQAVIATLTQRMWVHALAISWIFAVTIYNNLFISIGQ